MPPRPVRSTQGPISNQGAGGTPALDASSRSDSSISTAPSSSPVTPRGNPIAASALERGVSEAYEPLPEQLATSEDNRRLNDLVARLQQQLEDMQNNANRSARHVTIEQDERPIKEDFMAPTDYTTTGSRSKIKSSDLPKFYGKDHEDVDQWIEKVTAIFEYSNMRNNELLQHLPMILQGNALQWFTQLGARRHRYATWKEWQDAIRNAFYMPNHKANLRSRHENVGKMLTIARKKSKNVWEEMDHMYEEPEQPVDAENVTFDAAPLTQLLSDKERQAIIDKYFASKEYL
ncbi:hypothetical protein QFC21_006336 [Naganishia friedmannii]|uniref:Uncharacterized protein n=1 Tax=Naganishia friedmannii TaxID=89922 RepID=A0ACC2V3I5_9TREE|nr:hypothetical protein QFC21_006336 [Naganishia friedmannii]